MSNCSLKQRQCWLLSPAMATPSKARMGRAMARWRVVMAVALLCCGISTAAGVPIPGCSSGSCLLNTNVVVTSSTHYHHSGDLTVLEDGKIECLSNFCELQVTVTGRLELRGVFRAPIVKVIADDVALVGGLLDSSELGGLPGAGPGAGTTARSSSGGGKLARGVHVGAHGAL